MPNLSSTVTDPCQASWTQRGRPPAGREAFESFAGTNVNMPRRVRELTIRLTQHRLEKREVLGIEHPGTPAFGALETALNCGLDAGVNHHVRVAKASVLNVEAEVDEPNQFVKKVRRAGAQSARVGEVALISAFPISLSRAGAVCNDCTGLFAGTSTRRRRLFLASRHDF
jgi:hypothetical protein